MLKENLTQKGFTEEQITTIIAEINASQDYVPKAVFNGELDKVKNLKSQLDDRDNQLKTLSEKANGNDDLQKQIAKLQEDNKNAKKEYDAGLLRMRKEIALENKYNGYVYDLDDVKRSFDLDKIKINDKGEIIDGFDEQDKVLRETKPHYFKEQKKDTNDVSGLSLGQASDGVYKPIGDDRSKAIEMSKQIVAQLFPAKKE